MMNADLGLEISKIRCAPFHDGLNADPIGSAGAYDGFLCVEVSAPWERDISLNEPFVSLLDGAKVATGSDGRVWRPQGLKPRNGHSDVTRLLAFDRPIDTAAGPFRRREWSVPNDRVLALCRAILGIGEFEVSEFHSNEVPVPEGIIDLLICTHGKRDVCCGGMGTSLHGEIEPKLRQRTDVRLWRTSHTGGHRFAPTALTFPDGYAWAHLDENLVDALVDRSGPASTVARSCRGVSSIDGAPAQVADRAALEALGWGWATSERQVEVTAFDRESMATTVQITGTLPDGTTATFDVRAEVVRHVTQPTCGVIAEPEYKVESVWTAASVIAVSPGLSGESDAQANR